MANNRNNLRKKADRFGRRNPSHGSARDMAEAFHGRQVDNIIEIDELEREPTKLAVIGDLENLVVVPFDSKSKARPEEFEIEFKAKTEDELVRVCTDKNGQQIYFIGGDQDLHDFVHKISGTKPLQRFLILGWCRSIQYWTDKHHLEESDDPWFTVKVTEPNGAIEIVEKDLHEDEARELAKELKEGDSELCVEYGVAYNHEFGEQGGNWPTLVYDLNNKKLMLAGGTYEVRDVGIYD